jgi:serine/threonine-protein kinase
MIELRTLGLVDLRGLDGQPVRAVLAQPKRLALLAYLALVGSNGFRRRDTVVALLWPELDQEHARNALRQALWFLRRSLGEGAIIGRSEEEVGVSPVVLRCDATDFDTACAEGRPAEALELYRGDYLEGFFVSDASAELEQWIDEQRARLRRRAAEAAWMLADERAALGDHMSAADWAHRALAFSPTDEAAVRRLIVMLDRLGDRAGAVRAFETFAARLAKELDLAPDPETTALVQSLAPDARVELQQSPRDSDSLQWGSSPGGQGRHPRLIPTSSQSPPSA